MPAPTSDTARMRHGIFVAPFRELSDPGRMVDLAVAAEGAGWEGFFLWDHVLAQPDWAVADPWTILAAAARATRRIRIGTMVTPLARRRPWVLARQVATLDGLSDGRLVLGVGLGDDGWQEFSAFGEDPDPRVRASALDEGLEVLRGLLGEGPTEFQGSVHRIHVPSFLPPTTQPQVPMWAACRWPRRRPLRRAARLEGCFPIFPGGWPPARPDPGAVATVASDLRALGARAPYDLAVTWAEWAHPASSPAELRDLEAAGATWALEWLGPEGLAAADVEGVVQRGPST